MLDATPLLKFYSKIRFNRLSNQNPAKSQLRQLFWLLHKAQHTRFGKDHGFSDIRSVSQYQSQVPLRKYENFWNDYWKTPFPFLNYCTWPGQIRYFALSSGTSSGTTKFIPYSDEMIRSTNTAGMDIFAFHFANFPKSKILTGKNFILGGSTSLNENAPGIYSGDMSGIAYNELPSWTSSFVFPPPELALLSNWEEKIDKFTDLIRSENITMMSGVPSWMLIFFDKLRYKSGLREANISSLLPNLNLLIHGGVNFDPYLGQFERLVDPKKTDLREVYPASEGFIAVADRSYGGGLRMVLDHGIFYEFVPLDELENRSPTRHWIGNVRKDINYAIILSTCAGLWSYILGDTVKFVDTDPPRIKITGRISYYLSAFGEHLIAEEIEKAVSEASRSVGLDISDYSVGAVYPSSPGDLGGHLYLLEFASSIGDPEVASRLSDLIDRRLCELNEDYEAHRSRGFGLKAPSVILVPPGTFSAWMKSRGKLGGQNKVPRVINDQVLFKTLMEFIGK